MKEIISELIKTNRPKLSPSSVKTYVSLLTSMYNKNKSCDDNEKDKEWFSKNCKTILESFKSLPENRRKTQLSALYIVTQDKDVHNQMLKDLKVVNDHNALQKKSVHEEENWLSPEQIKTVYDQLKETATKMLNNKMPIDYEKIVQFFLLGFLGGVSGLSPRRSLDYALLKFQNYDPKSENYIDKKGILFFNVFKTAKFYGSQQLSLKGEAPALFDLLKKWNKINPTDYVLFSSTQQPLTSSNITKIFSKIFEGRNISTNLFRHIFLSDQYKNVPALQKMQQTASEMGHSVDQALLYVKK